jgi:hypothetical protein
VTRNPSLDPGHHRAAVQEGRGNGKEALSKAVTARQNLAPRAFSQRSSSVLPTIRELWVDTTAFSLPIPSSPLTYWELPDF